MSLRVLLADESPSIKKAFSIALQDYNVQIQTVHQSVDLQEIYQTFQPDICFMDVLLPKLNGYDACQKLKADKASSQTPVVLMWSGFMELNQAKFKSCKADESIEKPFETNTLRAIVKKLVLKLNQNELSDHLIIDTPLKINNEESPLNPKNIKSNENTSPLKADNLNNSFIKKSNPQPLQDLNLDDNNNLPPIPDFESILKKEGDTDSSTLNAPEGLDDVDSFSLHSFDDNNLPFESLKENLPKAPKDSAPNPSPILKKSYNPVKPQTQPLKLKDKDTTQTTPNITSELSKEELKRLILAQSNDIIESIVWDVVPELAKEMIQKEIQRLTGEIKYEDNLR